MKIKEDNLNISDLRNHAVKSTKWTALTEIVSRSASPLVMLILARLLTPEDFGIVAVAMIAIGFAQSIKDFGFEKALIQRETKITESANIVFWSNIITGFFIYLVIFLFAPLIADFFHESNVIDVLRVLCLQIILLNFATVHSALLQREFQFKKLFFARLALAFVPGVVSIPLALIGWGVWAIVWGSLAGTFVQVVLLWHLSDWRPKLSFDVSLARQLSGFGIWVTVEMVLGWLILWMDSIILGHFLGVQELGVYRVGITFLTLAFGIFLNPITFLVYPYFSRLQSNHTELKSSFLKVNQLIVAFAIPIGIVLALTAYPVSSLVFGQKWQGVEIVILILSLQQALAWFVGINNSVYRAVGKPDVSVKLLIVNISYRIPVYILAAPHGLLVFCLAKLGVNIVGVLLHFFVVNRLFQLPFTYLKSCVKSPLIASLVMGVLLYGMVNLFNPFEGWQGWLKLALVLLLAVGSYLVTMWLLDRKFTQQTIRLIKEGIL